MTVRHQIGVAGRIGRGRSPIDATPAPSVGEILFAARERKGVDLHRAERDTKIRAKHLAALENGDYAELPGTVYARGFLRNYATYLGLDAEEVLDNWRVEQEAVAPLVREPIVMPPQPLIEPMGHLRFTRQVFIGAMLILVVVGFLGYVGVQLLRFNHPPTLTLDQAAVQTLATDATSYTFSGKVDLLGAVVSVSSPSGFAQTTDADANGRWSVPVPVTKGQNDFTISARDPQLPPDKGSAPLAVRLIVPISATPTSVPQPSGSGPLPSGGAVPTIGGGGTPLPVAQLAVTAPTDGAQLTSGPVAVSGTSNAATVTVTAAYVGPAGVAAPSPGPTPSPVPGSSGSPSVDGPAPITLPVTAGTYSGSISLTPGRWVISVSAVEVAGSLAATSQAVTVDVTAGNGLVLEVHATNRAAWIRVIVDNKIVEQGRTFRRNESATYTGKTFITVTTGNAGSTDFVLNGKDFGTLGGDGQVQSWRFEKGKPPRPV